MGPSFLGSDVTFPDHRLVMCLLDDYTVIAIDVVLLAFFDFQY